MKMKRLFIRPNSKKFAESPYLIPYYYDTETVYHKILRNWRNDPLGPAVTAMCLPALCSGIYMTVPHGWKKYQSILNNGAWNRYIMAATLCGGAMCSGKIRRKRIEWKRKAIQREKIRDDENSLFRPIPIK